MKSSAKGGESEGFWGRLPTGWKNFRSAADYWQTIVALLVCPKCGSRLKKFRDGSGRYLCTNQLHPVTWSEQMYFQKVILAQLCPTCNSKLIRFGTRPGDKQRFRCRNEEKVWIAKIPAHGDAWASELGVPFSVMMRVVILWQLGWTKNRIHRIVKGRKSRLLQALDGLSAELIDVAIEAKPQVIYYCLWNYLLLQRKSRTLPVKLPRLADPWELKSAFRDFLAKVGSLRDERDKKLAARAVLGSLESLLMTIAQGTFGKRQLKLYAGRAQQHLLSFATRLHRSAPARQHLAKKNCYWCRALPTPGHLLDAEVESIIHRNALCREVKNVLDGLAGLANVADLLVDSPSKELEENLRHLAGDAPVDEILRQFPGASRAEVLRQGYEPTRPRANKDRFR